MKQTKYNGKAIYQPSGKAAEYSPWACNFFTGCSNDCEYCYCKRGLMSKVWDNKPHLKKCFKDEAHAIETFQRELKENLHELQKTGMLFSFTTDPMLPETIELTLRAVAIAVSLSVPCQILTKRTEWINSVSWRDLYTVIKHSKQLIAFGFTLTGFDEKEPFASSNQERIEAMRELHQYGFRTFASVEPVITPALSWRMIMATIGYCDLYKVGLISGKGKDFYNKKHLYDFMARLIGLSFERKVYLKDSVLDYLDIMRHEITGNFVSFDYNIFN